MDDLMALADEADCDDALPSGLPDSQQRSHFTNGNDLLDALADEATENCVEGSPQKTAQSLGYDGDVPRFTLARPRAPLMDVTNSTESSVRRTKSDDKGSNSACLVRTAVVATVDALRSY